MKPLPTTLTHSGYTLTQVERGPNWAIYSKAKPSHHNAHFEAIVIQHSPARTFPNGDSVPERESYPSSEQWGTYAWSVKTLEEARDKLKSFSV